MGACMAFHRELTFIKSRALCEGGQGQELWEGRGDRSLYGESEVWDKTWETMGRGHRATEKGIGQRDTRD